MESNEPDVDFELGVNKKLCKASAEGSKCELIYPEVPFPPYFIQNEQVYLMLRDDKGEVRPFNAEAYLKILLSLCKENQP